jgi:hypothetical protein
MAPSTSDASNCYDTSRSRGINIGGSTNILYTINWSAETVTTTALSPSGSTAILSTGGLSCFYDSARDSYWIFGGKYDSAGWQNIYEMNASTFAVTAHALTGTAIVVDSSTPMAGSWGRNVFLSAYRAIGIVAKHDQPASIIRLPAASGGDTTPPSAPSGLAVATVSSSQINLSWTASTDDVAVTGYNVERCSGSGCVNFVEVFTPSGVSQNDTGLSASTLYRYRVRAHDAAGNLSSYSSIGETTTSAAPGSLPSFFLTSTSTGTKPFAIGHGFKRGDIPAGNVCLSADAVDFQCTIKNAWPDGSAKFAIVSGRAALTANISKTINITAGADPGGTALTETDLTNTGLTASTQFGATCTVNLASLIGVASTFSGGRWTSGRVRQWVSGPKMSSWIYYSRCGSDAHLTIWFEVRLYVGGAVEVLPWVENSTLNVANPSARSATVTFTLGGSQRYSAALTFEHHTRAVLASGSTFTHWLGTDPAVTPKHDVAYLQATKLVPSYRGVTASNSALWSSIHQTYTPFTVADVTYADMGGVGYNPFIGLLPEWDVAYLTGNGDPRALAAVIVNDYAAGGFGIHYRDETTNQPPAFSSYPNIVLGTGSSVGAIGSSSINSYTPTATGGGGNWDTAHHPSFGYFGYLLTGRFYMMEETQFVSTVIFLQNSDTNRGFTQGVMRTEVGSLIPRGAAWALRSLAMAASATPDSDSLRTEFVNSYGFNVAHYHGKYVAQSSDPLGVVQSYDDYNGGAAPWIYAPWMDDFFTGAVGYGMDIVPGLSGTDQTKLTQFFTWKANAVVGRLGGTNSNEFYFADAANFNLPVGPNTQANTNYANGTGPWFANWSQAYKPGCAPGACAAVANPAAPADGNLRGGNFPAATSYWGNLQPAIAYAVNQGITGAQAAYNRMIGAGNWASLASGFNDQPVWGVMPTATTTTIPPPSAVMITRRRIM